MLAAVRTPPWPLVLSETDDPASVAALADGVAGLDLAGVSGPTRLARAFAERWARAAGRPVRLDLVERIHRATTIRDPRPVPGHRRIATSEDRDVLVEWLGAFVEEALGESDQPPPIELADRWLSGIGRTMHLWDDGGPVSLCGVGGATPNGIRIGPVYTPRDRRGRGYASALVASASRLELDAGRRFCFLFTDLGNPTANHIYAAIGYEPVSDVEVYRFDCA